MCPDTDNELERRMGEAAGKKISISLPPNSYDDGFIAAFTKVEEFIGEIAKPELIILQCCADCITGGPLTHLPCTSQSHRYDQINYTIFLAGIVRENSLH